MTEKELKATAPTAYMQKLPSFPFEELWKSYRFFQDWMKDIIAGKPSVDGWSLESLKAAMNATRERLVELQPPEYIFKPLFKREQIVEPEKLPQPSQLQDLVIGLDYGFRDATAMELVGWKDDTCYVLKEFYRQGLTPVPDVLVEVRRLEATLEKPVPIILHGEPSLEKSLRENDLPVETLGGRIEERRALLTDLFQGDKIRISSEAKGLISEILEYKRAIEDGLVSDRPDTATPDDAIEALGRAVMWHERKERERASPRPGKIFHTGEKPGVGVYLNPKSGRCIQLVSPDSTLPPDPSGSTEWIQLSASEELMPIRPSGKKLGRPVSYQEVLEHIKPFIIRSDIVRLTGGVVNRGSTEGDIEIYIEKLTWEELLRIMSFRIYRGLPEELADRLHFLDDHTGGCFTPNISLGDLWFIPKKEFVRQVMSLLEELRAAPPEIQKEAEESAREDRIKLDRYFYLLKPWRGAYAGEKQTIENFVQLFSEEHFPRLTSKKYDGNTFSIFKQGDQVRIYSDDGLPNKNFPNVEERIRRLPNSSLVLLAEFELWRDGVHYPREAVKAVASGARKEWLPDLIVNVFEVLYWNGRDIHKLPAEDRWAFAQRLDVDQSTEDVPDHGKLINLVPQHKTRNREELYEQTKRLSAKPASEGVVTKRGPWSLERQAKIDSSAKYHKAGWIKAVVVEKLPTKVSTIFNYTYGLPYEPFPLEPKEKVKVKGQELAVVGRTFNTTLDLSPGDLIEVEFETLNYTEDLDHDTFEISCWVPELLWAVENGEPTSVKEAIRIAKRAGVFQPKWIKGGETFYDERLVPAPVHLEELDLETFRAKGIDEDIANIKTNWRQCLADLRYLGNSAYPRLLRGETWNGWTIADVKAYFAALVNALRKAKFPLTPPPEGDPEWNSSYWRLYRECEKEGLITVPPPKDEEERRKWDEERAKIIETVKNITILHSPEYIEQFKTADPFMEYPPHGKKMDVMRHLHFRGTSVHSDYRRGVTPDYLVGWTENLQIEGAIKEPVLTMEQAKKIAANYSITKGNRYLKPLVSAGQEEEFGGHIVLEKKAPEPREWLDFEGVVPPGSVGATAFFPGVFLIMDKGKTEWGAQKTYFHEYFDSEGEIFNGIYVCRLLKNVWGPKLTGVGKFVWFGWYDNDPIPYVITERAVEKNWMPPPGQSALPAVLREHVPEELQYWKKEGSQARKLRDQLVKEKILTTETVYFNERNELAWKGGR